MVAEVLAADNPGGFEAEAVAVELKRALEMPAIDRVRIARETYGAYESGNREMVEKRYRI